MLLGDTSSLVIHLQAGRCFISSTSEYKHNAGADIFPSRPGTRPSAPCPVLVKGQSNLFFNVFMDLLGFILGGNASEHRDHREHRKHRDICELHLTWGPLHACFKVTGLTTLGLLGTTQTGNDK